MAGLFTSLVFNNGSDHTFVERGQLISSPNVIVRQYIEPSASTEAESIIIVKQDFASKNMRRALLQRKVMLLGVDGIYYPYTSNFTSIFNPKITEAAAVLEQKLLADAIADPTFHANFIKGLS